MISDGKSVDSEAELRDHVARLKSDLAAARAHSAELIAERDLLREAYRQLELQVQLQRRRLFVAKAERIDTQQLEIEFAATLAKLNEIAATLRRTCSSSSVRSTARTRTTRRNARRPDVATCVTRICRRNASYLSIRCATQVRRVPSRRWAQGRIRPGQEGMITGDAGSSRCVRCRRDARSGRRHPDRSRSPGTRRRTHRSRCRCRDR